MATSSLEDVRGIAPPKAAGLFAALPVSGWLLVWPALAYLAILFFYPVSQVIYLSFFTSDFRLDPTPFTNILESAAYYRVIVNTLVIASATTVACVLLGYPIAFLLSDPTLKRANLYLILVLVPFWTSYLVRTFAWMIILGDNGIINQAGLSLGLLEQPLRLMYNRTGVLIGMIHAMLPIAVLAMYAVMKGIDRRLLSAASTLGARPGTAFLFVFVPLSLPGVITAAVFVFVLSLGFFITPAILGGVRDTMIAQSMISLVQELLDWREASALAVVLVCITMLAGGIARLAAGRSAGAGEAAKGPGRVRRKGVFLALRLLGSVADAVYGAWLRVRQAMWRADTADGAAQPFLKLYLAVILIFLVAPTLVVIPVSLTTDEYLSLPTSGLTLRWYVAYFESWTWIDATLRSFLVGTVSATVATALGLIAAVGMVFWRLRGEQAVKGAISIPMILPRMIYALGAFYVFALFGLVGTTGGLILAHVVLALPFAFVMLVSVLVLYDRKLDYAAYTLGSGKIRTALSITIPVIKDGVLAAFLFSFITSFDDLTVSLFLSGGLAPTLPWRLWNDIFLQIQPTLAAVSTVMLVSITTAILLAELLRRRSFGGSGASSR